MILVYRPELESPPMDKECTIGFSFLTGTGSSEYISLKAGVTRNFPEDVWEKIKDYDVVKNLLSLGALRVDKEEAITTNADSAGEANDPASIANIALSQALELVENSFDLEQLNIWLAKEQRIKVRNSIMKRITSITEGNG